MTAADRTAAHVTGARSQPADDADAGAPSLECDLVLKGGLTSGIVYPLAVTEIGATYRLRGIGGASAGAIGAALGAAAEFGRASGGFRRLEQIPGRLADGRLATLFQAQPRTRPLLGLLLAATTGEERPGHPDTGPARRRPAAASVAAVAGAAARAFPLAGLVGAAPGLLLAGVGAGSGGLAGALLVVGGGLLAVVGWVVAVLVRLSGVLSRDVPANMFGICTGMGEPSRGPGLTEWLAERIDDIAGLPAEQRPLRFGHLWTGTPSVAAVPEDRRRVDLRMISTCVSQGRPYELPWEAGSFFYEPEAWARLFPADVMRALAEAPARQDGGDDDVAERRWEEAVAGRHRLPLRRLPAAEHLPVIVAARLSLSFPLLISAVPLWTIDRRSESSRAAAAAYRAAAGTGAELPATGLAFAKLWFTDGGLSSNFPVYLFDAALPTRPTFAINLGPFPADQAPSPVQRDNLEYARDNRQGILPGIAEIPESGFAALGAFASAAFNTARNWQDGSYLNQPGYRDRIVRILQSRDEGGLNLHMGTAAITRLAERGRAAGAVFVERFTQPVFGPATGWENHQWVRYRALLACLPEWLVGYSRGRAVLDVDPRRPPSYRLPGRALALAQRLTGAMDDAARVVDTADPGAVEDLVEAPRPRGAIRRVPEI